MVSKARLDLPDPDRPVKTIRASRGRSSETSLRLCSRAPRTTRRSAIRSHQRSESPSWRGRYGLSQANLDPRQDARTSTLAARGGPMSYPGGVRVGGPPQVRDLDGVRITKVATPPFDNNC